MDSKYITDGHKLAIFCNFDKRLANRESLNAVLTTWRKMINKSWGALKNKKGLTKGQKSTIKHIKEEMIGWALFMRNSGIGISYKMLQFKAGLIDNDFWNKSTASQ